MFRFLDHLNQPHLHFWARKIHTLNWKDYSHPPHGITAHPSCSKASRTRYHHYNHSFKRSHGTFHAFSCEPLPIVLSLFTFHDSGPSCTIFRLVKLRFCRAHKTALHHWKWHRISIKSRSLWPHLKLGNHGVLALLQRREIKSSLVVLQPLRHKQQPPNSRAVVRLFHVWPATLNCARLTCLFSASFTSWLTWLRIWRQHSQARFTLLFSSASSLGYTHTHTNSI